MKPSRFAIFALVSVASAARVHSQGVAPRPMLRTVAEAEAEGRVFPRGPAQVDTARLSMFARATRGSADRLCVDVSRDTVRQTGTNQPGLRFGDFSVAGGWGFEAGVHYKMWWNQLHHVAERTPMVVRSTRIDAAATPADTSRYSEDGPVYPASRLSPEEAARTGKTFDVRPIPYYMTSWGVPTAGTWLVVATAGDDWGCMVVRAFPKGGR